MFINFTETRTKNLLVNCKCNCRLDTYKIHILSQIPLPPPIHMTSLLLLYIFRNYMLKREMDSLLWKINYKDISWARSERLPSADEVSFMSTTLFILHGYITNSQYDQLLVGLIALLVEHCTPSQRIANKNNFLPFNICMIG